MTLRFSLYFYCAFSALLIPLWCSQSLYAQFDLGSHINAIQATTHTPLNAAKGIVPDLESCSSLKVLRKKLAHLPHTGTIQGKALVLLAVQDIMINLLVPTMQACLEYKAYWQNQLYHPYAYFFSKPPHKWVSGKWQKEDIQDTLHMIDIIYHNLAQHIGTLKTNIDEYETVKTSDELTLIVEKQEAMLVSFFGGVQHPDFRTNLDTLINNYEQYATSMRTMLKAYRPGGHLSRNWIAYTTAGFTLCAATYWYMQDPEGNKKWLQDTLESYKVGLNIMWSERVIAPLQDFSTKLFTVSTPPLNENDFDVPDDIISRDNLVAIIGHIDTFKSYKTNFTVEFGRIFAQDLSHLEALLEQYAGDIDLLISDANARQFCIEFYNNYIPFLSSKSGVLLHNASSYEKAKIYGKATFPHIRAIINNTMKAKIRPLIKIINDMSTKLSFIAPLVVLSPIVMLTYVPFNALKFTYNKFAPHKVAHKGILTTLLHLEELLNDYLHHNVMEINTLGIFTYYLALLRTYAQDLTPQERYDFCADVNKLFRAQRTLDQKLKDIEIIRKKYQFLT